jgi:acyl transferase domain-containing protein
MLAPDGRCKTLDAAADGYVRAEAVGVLLLQAAGAAADVNTPPPLALLAGSAVNQDGRSSGLTAPNGPAQQEVLRAALAAAGLAPGDVSGLQLHGTGTGLGDPIEVGAAAAVFGGHPGAAPLALTTSKASLGHAEPAAGVVGLLHAAHAACHGALPPLLHLRSVNPFVGSALPSAGAGWQLPRQLGGAPLAVTPAMEASPAALAGRVSGVSSFAFQVGRAQSSEPQAAPVCLLAPSP